MSYAVSKGERIMEEDNIKSTIKIQRFETDICVPCLVCGESIEVSYAGNHVKICEKCRKAILKIRKEMENE